MACRTTPMWYSPHILWFSTQAAKRFAFRAKDCNRSSLLLRHRNAGQRHKNSSIFYFTGKAARFSANSATSIRNNGLGERDAAIVRWTPGVQEHFKALAPKTGHGAFEQIEILECSAAQANAHDAFGGSEPTANLDDDLHDGIVERGGDPACRLPHEHVAHDFFDRRGHIDFPRVGACDFERVTCSDALVSGRLQLDGGLGFEIDFIPDANDACYGVEQTSAGGSLDGVDAALDHRANRRDLLWWNAPPQWQVQSVNLRAESIEQVAESH